MSILTDIIDGLRSFAQELNPFAPATEQYRDGSMLVGGVELPRNVVLQLQQLGIPITSYTPGELEAAIRACAVDSTLIDDHGATHFLDALEYTPDEQKADQGIGEKSSWRSRLGVKPPESECTFCEKLDAEREDAAHPKAHAPAA